MSSAQSEAILVSHADHIVRVSGFQHKADQPGPTAPRSENVRSRDLPDERGRLRGERLVVLKDALTADLVQIIGRRAQTDGLGDGGGPGLETMRSGLEFALREGHPHNHFSAPMKGLHFFKDFAPSVENARSGRPAHFVPGKRQKVAPDLPHIDGEVSRALRGIDQGGHARRALLWRKVQPPG